MYEKKSQVAQPQGMCCASDGSVPRSLTPPLLVVCLHATLKVLNFPCDFVRFYLVGKAVITALTVPEQERCPGKIYSHFRPYKPNAKVSPFMT